MKNCVGSLFTVMALFINVCEESVAKNMMETEQKIVALRKEVAEKMNKQFPEINHQKTSKEKQVEIENNSQFSESELNSLDLTVPLSSSVIDIADYALNKQKNNYLPDLFESEKDKQPSVQLVGKLIKREEEVAGKETILDGAGIDLKLLH